jgi:hypothetical protein
MEDDAATRVRRVSCLDKLCIREQDNLQLIQYQYGPFHASPARPNGRSGRFWFSLPVRFSERMRAGGGTATLTQRAGRAGNIRQSLCSAAQIRSAERPRTGRCDGGSAPSGTDPGRAATGQGAPAAGEAHPGRMR